MFDSTLHSVSNPESERILSLIPVNDDIMDQSEDEGPIDQPITIGNTRSTRVRQRVEYREEYEMDDVVQARWLGEEHHGTWFLGVVVTVYEDALHIRYDDGDEDDSLSYADVRHV